MANCVAYDCDDQLQDQLLNDCGNELQGGIDAALILSCDAVLIDPSDEVEIQALIDADQAKVYKNLRIGVPAASPVKIASTVACSPDKVVRYDRTATWQDGNVNDSNVNAYNDLFSSRSNGGIVFRECETGKVTFVDQEVKFEGSRVIPDNDGEFQIFDAILNWKTKPDEVDGNIFDEPTGIFD